MGVASHLGAVASLLCDRVTESVSLSAKWRSEGICLLPHMPGLMPSTFSHTSTPKRPEVADWGWVVYMSVGDGNKTSVEHCS